MKLPDFKTFLFEQKEAKRTQSRSIATTHDQFIDDIKRKKHDFATPDQEISSNKLMVGDFAIHKDKQELGPGQIKKIINDTHAKLHFNVDLESSLTDHPKGYETFTFRIADLIPVIATDDT